MKKTNRHEFKITLSGDTFVLNYNNIDYLWTSSNKEDYFLQNLLKRKVEEAEPIADNFFSAIESEDTFWTSIKRLLINDDLAKLRPSIYVDRSQSIHTLVYANDDIVICEDSQWHPIDTVHIATLEEILRNL